MFVFYAVARWSGNLLHEIRQDLPMLYLNFVTVLVIHTYPDFIRPPNFTRSHCEMLTNARVNQP